MCVVGRHFKTGGQAIWLLQLGLRSEDRRIQRVRQKGSEEMRGSVSGPVGNVGCCRRIVVGRDPFNDNVGGEMGIRASGVPTGQVALISMGELRHSAVFVQNHVHRYHEYS
jgi:hypothetical protein